MTNEQAANTGTLSDSDRAEIDRFKHYLRECAAWDKANDTLPDFAPISDLEAATYARKRLRAHADIFRRIYPEDTTMIAPRRFRKAGGFYGEEECLLWDGFYTWLLFKNPLRARKDVSDSYSLSAMENMVARGVWEEMTGQP